MHKTSFSAADLGGDCWAINDHGRTVATVTSQGYVDWLLRSPLEPGPLFTSIRKETHLCHTLGLKLLLVPPSIGGKTGFDIVNKTHAVEDGGKRLTLTGHSRTGDGRFDSATVLTLQSDKAGARYYWDCTTTLTCKARQPVAVGGLEYNNVYPGKCGRCFLFASQKEFNCTLMVDRDNTVWEFPHQHLMHYGRKIETLRFAEGTLAGFFGEKTGSPVVVVTRSSLPPTWAICDMYYDLHCCALAPEPIRPGQVLTFQYQVKYLPDTESQALQSRARRIPVTDVDRAQFDYPRLELGMNSFLRCVDIGQTDDASGFRPHPPEKVWDRETGHSTKGSLRITNTDFGETVWSAEPPTQIPARRLLRVRALARTQGAEGKGVFIRLRYHTFVWHPTPHFEWAKTLESNAVTGTSEGWTLIQVPPLEVPEKDFDYLLWFDVVLDGPGVAWVTDMDIELQELAVPPEQEEEGGRHKKPRTSRVRAKASAGATR